MHSESRAASVAALGRRVLGLGRALVATVQSAEISFLAAAIAYYAFVSFVPLLVLLLAAASFLGGDELAAVVLDVAGEVLSPVGRDLVRNALVGGSGRGPATLVSLVLLAWSSLKVFRGLDVAFSAVHGVDPPATFLGRVRDAAAALGGVGLGLAAVVAIGTLVGRTSVALVGVMGTLALVVVLALAFYPLYYLLPDRAESPLRPLPGTLVAAVGWTLLGTLFQFYVSVGGQSNVYGVLGVVLLLVTWFYVGSMTLLVGAALNAVLAGRTDETGTNKGPPVDVADTERP